MEAGKPYFTTDRRGNAWIELKCDAIPVGKNGVNGVYDEILEQTLMPNFQVHYI